MPDTGIARHVIKGRSPAVATRLSSIPPDRIYISAVTRALQDKGRGRPAAEAWLGSLKGDKARAIIRGSATKSETGSSFALASDVAVAFAP